MPKASLRDNPTTTISFDLPENSRVSLKIYDIQGRLVKTLLNRELPAGRHKAFWNGVNDRGTAAASGVYLYHFKAGSFQETRKMLLIR